MKYINMLIVKICNQINLLRNRSKIRQIGRIGRNYQFAKGLRVIGGQAIFIGDNFYAGPNCRFETYETKGYPKQEAKIRIGNNVRINSNCHIGALNNITIGNDVLFGSHVFITDHSHGATNAREDLDNSPHDRELVSKGTVIIGNNCWICENVIILPNVKIGSNSIIAAGAVVTKDVPDFSIVAGNPAKVVKQF